MQGFGRRAVRAHICCRYEYPRPTPRTTLSLLISTFCPSFCCATIIALMFFMPYFFVVYQPNHAPENWKFTTCSVVSKSSHGMSTSRQSQDMFYTIFTLGYIFNNTDAAGQYAGCHRTLSVDRDSCSEAYTVNQTFACRFDPKRIGEIVLAGDWSNQVATIFIIMLSVTLGLFSCCFMYESALHNDLECYSCLCVGILCSNRIKERDSGYTTL